MGSGELLPDTVLCFSGNIRLYEYIPNPDYLEEMEDLATALDVHLHSYFNRV